jgi:Putative adhesin Stv domain
MLVYIISAHGESHYNKKTVIPANTTVNFYQRFGQEMPMDKGFKLQTAITHPGYPTSKSVLERYKSVALWNGTPEGRTQQPEVYLTPDPDGEFKSGVVRADPDFKVVCSIDEETTLSAALEKIRSDADAFRGKNEQVDVHCLFCL